MTPEEARAATKLAGQLLAGTVAHVEQVHVAVARRAFNATAVAGPVRAVHDALAGGIYRGVRSVLLAAGGAASGIVGLVPRPKAPHVGTTTRSNIAVAALNAAIGDRLAGDYSALAIEMSLRSDNRDLPAHSRALAGAYPAASGRLAVFLHGLGETEQAWQLHSEHHYAAPGVTYASRLESDFGFSPVFVRYNTGLHVSENGRKLARLLDEVVAGWPVAVEEIVIVGHSMGGLVARSACYYGDQGAARWVPAVRHVFYLGAPHLGAPLERAAGYLGWTMSKVGEMQPWAALVNGRSSGIKDLRFGYVVEDDWRGCDPDRCLDDHRHDVPLLPSASHYVIGATLATDPEGLAGRAIGDLLVQPASAHGRHPKGRHVRFELENSHHLGKLTHFHLLNHPAIYELLRARVDAPTAPRVDAPTAPRVDAPTAPRLELAGTCLQT